MPPSLRPALAASTSHCCCSPPVGGWGWGSAPSIHCLGSCSLPPTRIIAGSHCHCRAVLRCHAWLGTVALAMPGWHPSPSISARPFDPDSPRWHPQPLPCSIALKDEAALRQPPCTHSAAMHVPSGSARTQRPSATWHRTPATQHGASATQPKLRPRLRCPWASPPPPPPPAP